MNTRFMYVKFRPCTCTIVSLTFARYVLRPFYPDCDTPNGLQELVAIALISGILIVDRFSKFNFVFSDFDGNQLYFG